MDATQGERGEAASNLSAAIRGPLTTSAPHHRSEFRDMKMQPSLERALSHRDILGA